MGKIYEFLKSKNLTIILLLSIAFFSILGTIFSYGKINNQNLSIDPATWLSHFESGQFYHSPVFVLNLVFLGINLIVCIYDRIKSNGKRLIHVYFEVEEEYIKNLPLCNLIFGDFNKNILENILAGNSFKVYKKGALLYGEKGRINIWGTYITHVSIILVLIAGTISALYGFTGTVGIFEGMETNRYYNWTYKKYMDLPFSIKVEKLDITYYPVLLEVEAGKRENKKKYFLKKGDEFIYQNDRIVFSEFLPDSMVMNNEVYSVSESLHIPAVLFKIYHGDKFVSNYWIFAEDIGYKNKIKLPYPLIILKSQYIVKQNESVINIIENEKLKARDSIRPNKLISYGKLNIYFWGFGQDDYRNYFTGLQISYDPGIWLMWTGLAGILTGIFIIFFVSYDRVWIKLSNGMILIGGKTRGDGERFKRKMETLIEMIKGGL